MGFMDYEKAYNSVNSDALSMVCTKNVWWRWKAIKGIIFIDTIIAIYIYKM